MRTKLTTKKIENVPPQKKEYKLHDGEADFDREVKAITKRKDPKNKKDDSNSCSEPQYKLFLH